MLDAYIYRKYIEFSLMKNGVSYTDIKNMSEKEVMEFFTIMIECGLYEQERIEMIKGSF